MAEQRNIPADLVEIGMLARPHGIRGEIRVNYYADSLELLREDGRCIFRPRNKPPRKMRSTPSVCIQGTPLIRFVEAPDRTAAEFLRGRRFSFPNPRCPSSEEQVYLHICSELSVVLDATGQKARRAGARPFHGEQELWEGSILTPEGQGNPASRRARIDRGHRSRYRIIRITPPEGLLELYMCAFTAAYRTPHLAVESWPFSKGILEPWAYRFSTSVI